jgi:deazaflavin-dependent oxidoreductase (nitroreductase family)
MDTNMAARLNRVAGKRTLTLTHYGRKSGKPYNVTIWFAVEGDKVYIGTADASHQWVRNVQKTPRVRLSIGGGMCWERVFSYRAA